MHRPLLSSRFALCDLFGIESTGNISTELFRQYIYTVDHNAQAVSSPMIDGTSIFRVTRSAFMRHSETHLVRSISLSGFNVAPPSMLVRRGTHEEYIIALFILFQLGVSQCVGHI